MPLGNTSLPEPILTNIYVAVCRRRATVSEKISKMPCTVVYERSW